MGHLTIEILKDHMLIQRASWYENHNHWNMLSQIYGGAHPKTQAQHAQVEDIKASMRDIDRQIKELEGTNEI